MELNEQSDKPDQSEAKETHNIDTAIKITENDFENDSNGNTDAKAEDAGLQNEEDLKETKEDKLDKKGKGEEAKIDKGIEGKEGSKKKKKSANKNSFELDEKASQEDGSSPITVSPDTQETSKPPLKRRQTKTKPKSAKDGTKPKSPKIAEKQHNKDDNATTKTDNQDTDRPQSATTEGSTSEKSVSSSKSSRLTPTIIEKRPSGLSTKKSSFNNDKEASELDFKSTIRRPSVQANLKGILKKFESAIQQDTHASRSVQFNRERSLLATRSPLPQPTLTPVDDDVMTEGYGPQTRFNKMWLRALTKLELILPHGRSSSQDGKQHEEKFKEILSEINQEIDSGRLTELVPTVNGLKQFGIAKSGITRAVVQFTRPPEEHPLTLCFHFPHTFLNHSYVRHMVLSNIRKLPGSRIVYVQYQDRNVFHGARAFDNRWIVKVSNLAAFDVLRKNGIDICNRKIAMRPYDEMLKEEYEEYLEYMNLQKIYMYDQIRSLVGMPNNRQHTAPGPADQSDATGQTTSEPPVNQDGNTSDDDSLIDYEDKGTAGD